MQEQVVPLSVFLLVVVVAHNDRRPVHGPVHHTVRPPQVHQEVVEGTGKVGEVGVLGMSFWDGRRRLLWRDRRRG